MTKLTNWIYIALLETALGWQRLLRRRLCLATAQSSWWSFVWDWKKLLRTWLATFMQGDHQFAPIIEYQFKDEIVRVWSYLDRLILHLILKIIKATFKHVISPLCLHLQGPSAIKGITRQTEAALATGRYEYCLRIDIKSYYASINHKVLLKQLMDNYDDPRLKKYFTDIVTAAVDCGGQIILPKQGIPLRSSLSPFFGALYLTSLDRAFENRPRTFYVRYMDDIIILVKNKRQYAKARKTVFGILKELKLQASPHKTRMGKIKKGFHFLGVNFAVSRNQQSKNQEPIKVGVDLHPRTCRRALDTVAVMQQDAVNPAKIQRYLSRWAAWWHPVTRLEKNFLLYKWVKFTDNISPKHTWFGRGLLVGSDYYNCSSYETTISFSKLNQSFAI